jgi:hypothetical protein
VAKLVPIGVLARICEVDPRAIRKAVEKGQLDRRPDGMFDLETARQQWEENVEHTRGRDTVNPRVVEMRREEVGPDAPAEIPERATRGTEYAKARAAVQIYEARLKKLRFEERAGRLAPTCDIQHARFQEMRIIRDACLNLPGRVSAALAAETDEHKVFQLLENELLKVFNDYSDGKYNPRPEDVSA